MINSRHPALDEILARLRPWFAERGCVLRPPCPEEELKRIKEDVQSEFGIRLPSEYADFLRTVDGLDFNGTLFFAATSAPNPLNTDRQIEGLVEANRGRRCRIGGERVLFLGESGMETYVYDPAGPDYKIIDSVAMDPYEVHPNFDDLLRAAFEDRLP